MQQEPTLGMFLLGMLIVMPAISGAMCLALKPAIRFHSLPTPPKGAMWRVFWKGALWVAAFGVAADLVSLWLMTLGIEPGLGGTVFTAAAIIAGMSMAVGNNLYPDGGETMKGAKAFWLSATAYGILVGLMLAFVGVILLLAAMGGG